MKLRLITLLLVLSAVTLAACAAPPQLRNEQFLQDTSLVDSEPCGSPCWRNITPGETDWSDALTLLEDDASLSDLRIETSEETGEIAATFQQTGGIPCCLMYTESGETVDQMLLQVAPEMTVAQVLETHGEPTFVSPAEITDDQASIAMYYQDLNTVVYAFVEGAGGDLNEDSEIFAVLYVRPQDMEEILTNSTLYTWQGYQSFSAYTGATPAITPEPTAQETQE